MPPQPPLDPGVLQSYAAIKSRHDYCKANSLVEWHPCGGANYKEHIKKYPTYRDLHEVVGFAVPPDAHPKKYRGWKYLEVIKERLQLGDCINRTDGVFFLRLGAPSPRDILTPSDFRAACLEERRKGGRGSC